MRKNSGLRQFWIEFRWVIIGFTWVSSLLLGFIGFYSFSLDNELNWSIGDIVYRTLQLPKLSAGDVNGKMNGNLEVARFLLPGISVYAIILGFFSLMEKQLQWLRLITIRDHIVICGLGRKGGFLAKDLLSQGLKVVVIESDSNCKEAKLIRKKGGIVLEGDATKQEVLNSAKIFRAKHLICLLGNDSLNLQAAMQAYQITKKIKSKELNCTICITSKDLVQLIKNNELFPTNEIPFRLMVFNPYDRTARSLLIRDEVFNSSSNDANRHLLIIGWGQLGESLIIQAANTWGFSKKCNLVITVLDRSAQERFSSLVERYPSIQQNCKINPINVDLSNNFQLISELQRLEPGVDTAYLCLSDPVLSLQVYLCLLRLPNLRNIQYRIRLDNQSDFSTAFTTNILNNHNSKNVMLFDLYENSCKGDLVLTDARTNLARGLFELYNTNSINDPENMRITNMWEQLSIDEKRTNLNQADRIFLLLNSIGRTFTYSQCSDEEVVAFTEDEIETMAKLEHSLWCKEKTENGWRYSDVRDTQLKTHPVLIPWDKLPDHEKAKNRKTVIELPNLLATVGFQIEKIE